MQSAVIVAGGRSTRFGDADKAVADLAGTPMVRRVADRLTGVVDELVVNCRADQRDAIADALDGYERPVAFALDPAEDEGPMAGIRTGLRGANGEYAAVVACDMPFVDPAFVAYLFERAAGADAAVPRVGDGWFQTTQAVYRADAMAAACEDALDAGERKILEPLFTLDYEVVTEREVEEHAANGTGTFENLNTRAELEDAQDAF
ncbi:molybdenum cofactor guanylyltransferase [Salarchaeum sp. JOR-1]|uniref:molybdenum cofactor guanylyltransferase n=1 Tax=Salarchaeum sp. JOR-1 TaxID=2599399 RepID=UPI00119849FE|nr:molybdenum cofactor guanylyltransferase [Salarchaeum sp. JOR-1]QDX41405.1 molybdenum cofactor guanylyltransferase [Salarchaeum sp. JOR-1]